VITRRAFMGIGLATIIAPKPPAPRGDPALLGLLLAVEQAQVALYEHAASLPFRGPPADLARRFADEERQHAQRLQSLGAKPPRLAPASFTFSKPDEFLRLAQRLEGLAVGAYNGAIAQLGDTALIVPVAAMAQVEGRHSAAIRVLRNTKPAPRAYDRSFAPDRAQHALTALLSG
jgi:hypothetical protein